MQFLLLAAAALVTIAPVQQSQPNRQPQLAASDDLTALVFGSGTAIWFASSRDGGASFQAPVEVTKLPALALGRHRGPRVSIAGNDIVVTAVMGSGMPPAGAPAPRPAFGDLAAWRSNDGGKTWSKPVAINDFNQAAKEGLHAIATDGKAELASVWLDSRQKGMHLYGAYSRDGGETWSKNVLIYASPDGTICTCCDPSILSTGNHDFRVMFRNVISGNRDMYVVDWRTGSKPGEAAKAGSGSWKLDACPMDGGGVVRVKDRTMTAWRREETVYLDELGKPEVALGKGKDVAIAGGRDGAYVAWTGESGVVVYEPGASQPHSISPGGKFPVLVALPEGGALAAWEEGDHIAIEALKPPELNARR